MTKKVEDNLEKAKQVMDRARVDRDKALQCYYDSWDAFLMADGDYERASKRYQELKDAR